MTKTSLKGSLHQLVKALDRTHAVGYCYSEEAQRDNDMPIAMVRSKSGPERYFNATSERFLLEFSRTLYDSTDFLQKSIQLKELVSIVRQAVGDFHAADAFANIQIDSRDSIKVLKEKIIQAVEAASDDYTHHFPAWTAGFEQVKPLRLGPVWIRSRTDWVKSVDFHVNQKASYQGNPEANANWQEILIEALNNRKNERVTPGLAGTLHPALRECPAVVSVTVRGAEFELSRKLASLVCKCALDCLSLNFGQADIFSQQVLYEERVTPLNFSTIVEAGGFLSVPGGTNGARLLIHRPELLDEALNRSKHMLEAFASILAAHVDPTTHKHPKLSNRWSTALEWFAEGNRESNDSIALAKLGVCLDILSSGGEGRAILKMLTQLTDKQENDIVISGLRPVTLRQLVLNIYNEGRSKILHGNRYQRLNDFAQERRRAMEVGQIALLACAYRLHAYTGEDVDKAFLTMPPVVPPAVAQ